MIGPDINPTILKNFQETAEALLHEDGHFANKELNENGQLVDLARSGMSDDLKAREELIGQFIKLYKEKVEVLLPSSAKPTEHGPTDKNELLARIARAVIPPAKPAPVVKAPPTAAEAAKIKKANDDKREFLRQIGEQDTKWNAQREGYVTTPRPRAAGAAAPKAAGGGAAGPAAPRGADSPEVKAKFAKYGELPTAIRRHIAAGSDPRTKGALGTTATTERQPVERPYHEACALIAFCDDKNFPAGQKYLDGLSADKRAVLAKLRSGKDGYEKLDSKQKKVAIELSADLRRFIEAQDRSGITRLDARFPIRALPADFATLFPNLEVLNFQSDGMYGDVNINLPRLKELQIGGFQTGNLNIQCPALVKLSINNASGIKVMPDLTGCGNLAELALSGSKLTEVDSGRLPPSLRQLVLTGNPQLSRVRLALPELRNLQINASPALTAFPELTTPQLAKLDLANNQIQQMPDVPFKKLEALNLNGNPIREMPASIGGSPKLVRLDLARTAIRHLPREMTGLKLLERIDISGTPFDHVPPVLALMNGLTVINMANVRATIPDWLGEYPPRITEIYANPQGRDVLNLENNGFYDASNEGRFLRGYRDDFRRAP